MLRSLGRSMENTIRPWFCILVPSHFGSYFHGTPSKEGGYTTYRNAMAQVCAEGTSALEAVTEAIALLDKSEAKVVYEDLEQAFEDNIHGRSQKARNRGRDKDG